MKYYIIYDTQLDKRRYDFYHTNENQVIRMFTDHLADVVYDDLVDNLISDRKATEEEINNYFESVTDLEFITEYGYEVQSFEIDEKDCRAIENDFKTLGEDMWTVIRALQ